MFNMRTVVETRQVAKQAQPSDGAPAHKFNQPVGGMRLRRDQHWAAGVFAVAERQEKRAPLVPLRIVIASQRHGAAAQLHHAHEYTEQISQIAERLEHAVGQNSNVSRKTHTQKIEGVDFAGRVRQPQEIDSAGASFRQRLHRSCGSVFCEIAQKRIACAQRQETQRNSLNRPAFRKDSIENFVSGAVATDGQKAPVTLIVGFARKLHRMARTRRGDDVDLQPFLSQTSKRRSREFRGATATGGGVNDGEKSVHGERAQIRNYNFLSTRSFLDILPNGRIPHAQSSFSRRSANTLRLILREAVLGKSSSSRTTPWMRL